MIYKLALFSFLLGLFSFTPVNKTSITDPSVVGKWYNIGGFRYERGGKETTVKSWYEFKKNGRVYFSTCTDACGCIRKTLRGKWTQESMSIVNITFFKYKSEYSKRRRYTRINESRAERYAVRRVDKNILIINPLPVKTE